MLSYSSLDELDKPLNIIERQQQPHRQTVNTQIDNKPFAKENTECNYLVMFFVIGMFIIVISDQLK